MGCLLEATLSWLNSPNFMIWFENALGYLHQNWGVSMPLLFGAEVSYEEM
jgi:hypothetical protein